MRSSQREVPGTSTVETGAKTWQMANNMGIQQGDPEKADDDSIAITTSTSIPNAKHPVAPANEKLDAVPSVTVGSGPAVSSALPSHPVGRGISLPFGQLLPQCANCGCNALIAMTPYFGEISVLCLDHGLLGGSATRNLTRRPRCSFISPEHEAAIRAFLA